MTAKQTIEAGKAILGIEFGSTRIKAVLIRGSCRYRFLSNDARLHGFQQGSGDPRALPHLAQH